VFWRKKSLQSIGGWPGLNGSEDTAILLWANAQDAVLFIDHHTLDYRMHDNQISDDRHYQQLRGQFRHFLLASLAARGFSTD